MTNMRLYGHPDSGHACKVALALRLLGLPHEVQRVDIWAPPDTRPKAFLDANPAAEVPVLMIGTQPFRQSGAILLELGARFDLPGPAQPDALQRAREIICWEANRIGMCLPQLIEARRPGATPFPPGAVAWLEGRYHTDTARFALLLGDAPFLHGDAPGLGDCAVWGYAQWIEAAGMVAPPPLAAWRQRMRALPQMASPDEMFPAG